MLVVRHSYHSRDSSHSLEKAALVTGWEKDCGRYPLSETRKNRLFYCLLKKVPQEKILTNYKINLLLNIAESLNPPSF
jgi:hypothetical protein